MSRAKISITVMDHHLYSLLVKNVFQDVTANEDWNQCLDSNGMSLARCIYNCGDNSDCEIDCVANFKTKTLDCPCEVS